MGSSSGPWEEPGPALSHVVLSWRPVVFEFVLSVDLSMVALLCSPPLPLTVVCLPGLKTSLSYTGWCRVSPEKVTKQENASLLEERIWQTLPPPLFKSTSSLLDVASNRTVNLVPGE